LTTTTRPPYADRRVGTLEFWQASPEERERSYFAHLRDTAPVSWQPPAQGTLPLLDANEEGFWAVVGHPEIIEVSKDPETFCSGRGFMYEDFPPEAYEALASMMALDAPEHGKIRRLVSAAFTPKRVATIQEQIKNQARQIVTDLLSNRSAECDFVEHVSARLPLWTISEMMGVPVEARADMIAAVSKVNGLLDPEINQGRNPMEVQQEGVVHLHGLAHQLAEQRRLAPQDDLMSALVHAEIDGERLTPMQIASFFCILTAAGNDTTRNTTTIAMQALCAHPEQRAALLADLEGLLPTAIEEIVRWTSPVLTMRRTATRDTFLAGAPVREGDKVVMFYPSGNFDPRVFDDPNRFDITRPKNPHIAFGGRGPHFCLGNHLARTQLKAILTELLTRVPDLQVGEPEYEVSTIIRSVKRMPCTFTPQR